MKFGISIPGQKDVTTEGTYEEAISAFEEALWEAGILPEDENLNASDLGYGGGTSLRHVLETTGLLHYGEGADVPTLEKI